MANRPAFNVVAVHKRSRENISIGSIWASDKIEGAYNLRLGDREVSTEKVVDILGSGEYYLNVWKNDGKRKAPDRPRRDQAEVPEDMEDDDDLPF